jgi:hypothetical protein
MFKTKTEEAPAAPWTGPRWEHRVEEFRSGPTMGAGVARRLGELGAQGWEVVAILEDGVTSAKVGDRQWSAVLKRPVL